MTEKELACSFSVTFRDKAHFDRVVKWLNNNVGPGKDNWTLEGKVLTHLRKRKQISRKVKIFNKEFDETSAVYLSLI